AIANVAVPGVVALFALGGVLGVALYHASFGFTSAYRAFLSERRSAGLRAQLVMLALAVVLFFPALGAGQLFGHPVSGNVSPLGTSVVVGAFLFGVGMQLGGGCASGTLFAAGGGSTRMLVTLAFFIVGSVVGVAQLGWWQALPSLPPVSLVTSLGWPVALALNLAAFAAIYVWVKAVERRRHGEVAPISGPLGVRRLISGPWPIVAGGLVLAVGNFATLALAGRPWGITSAFGLWGGKLAGAAGIDLSAWGGWAAPAVQHGLAQPLLTDITSVMDFGIMLGALLAAALAGRFLPARRVPLGQLTGSVVGGLLMGYGARLAYGCNIGAFFSGIASGSLHGWLWIAAALVGSAAGIRLRPAFGMAPPPVRGGC
ncbi:MAG: YeeE/YedE family protein, partial [Nevskia sp.]|nr:YeeE/YedE family protein [Nevskia sp.]